MHAGSTQLARMQGARREHTGSTPGARVSTTLRAPALCALRPASCNHAASGNSNTRSIAPHERTAVERILHHDAGPSSCNHAFVSELHQIPELTWAQYLFHHHDPCWKRRVLTRSRGEGNGAARVRKSRAPPSAPGSVRPRAAFAYFKLRAPRAPRLGALGALGASG